MVNKFKKILSQLDQSNKEVSLLALLKMDELTDRWSVVFSAPGLDDEDKRRSMFSYLVDLILKNLSDEEVKTIARVGVLQMNNHLVQDLLKYKKDFIIESSIRVNGNIIHEGHILESRYAETSE